MTHSINTSCLFLTAALCLSTTDALAQRRGKAKQEFVDGQAVIVDAFSESKDWIQHDLWVETEFDSDGDGAPDRVHVDVTRPGQTDSQDLRVHVIYETSPYFSGTSGGGKSYFWNPSHEVGVTPPERNSAPPINHQSKRPLMSRSQIKTWVPRGFAVVHSASPGTGLSQGCPTVGGANEALAPKAVIDWLNGRASGFTEVEGGEEVKAYWCTGKVGMTGTSYNGTLPLAAATTGVDGLEAIIPIAPNTSYYHYYRANGLVRHPGGWMGEDIDVLYDFINSGYPDMRETCNCDVRDDILMAKHDREAGDYNEFWAGRDYGNQLGSLKAATFLAHGFNDWNVMPNHSVRIYQTLQAKGVPSRVFFHQGGHGGGPPMEQMNRWFTRYVCGVKNGGEKDPRSLVVREGAKRSEPTAYANYPHPEAEDVTVFLGKGGQDSGTLVMRSPRNQGSETLVDDASVSGAKLASAEKYTHRLLYATKPLKRPVHLSGTARIKLRVASSKSAANLSVWLVSLPWTDSRSINDNIITRGWADPQNHASLTGPCVYEEGDEGSRYYVSPEQGAPLTPGEAVTLSFDLEPDDQIIPEGASIGLMIFSSDRDFTLWPEPGTELTVDLTASHLHLPVVGGYSALSRAIK